MNICKVFEDIRPPKVYTMQTPTACANADLVIGLELETEKCDRYTGGEYMAKAVPLNFMVETDGSLRGSAYEFISRPMKSTYALTALDMFFKAMGFTADNYSDRCSVHVHVNCTDMTTEQVSNVALLYSMTEDILFEFIGGDRDTNIFCVPWNQCRAQVDLVERFVTDAPSTLRGWNKYTALNLIPLKTQGTIEFRQMHGTSDIAKLTTWINIIGCMFSFANKTTLKDLIARIKELGTSSQYEMFFQELFKGYLPYNEVYKLRMEEGVILAKFSLLNHKEDRPVAPKKPEKKIVMGTGVAATAPINNFFHELTLDDLPLHPRRNDPRPNPVAEWTIDEIVRRNEIDRDMALAREHMRMAAGRMGRPAARQPDEIQAIQDELGAI